jgi:2',3'-cyclic-nucleotide 2'-phosphodiesterase (5'-nucleotidase family)
MRRTIIGFSIVLLITFLIIVAVGDTASQITIFFTGEIRGNFEPCGCDAGPTGGLARRLAYSQSYSNEEGGAGLHVDAGSFFNPPGPSAKAVNQLMKMGLNRTPVRVLNLSVDDLYWWKDLSKEEFHQTTLISTNLFPRNSSVPSPDRYAVVEVPLSGHDGRVARIGFLGLSDPKRVKPNTGFRGVDPLQAVAEIKEEVLGKSDFLIVLADWIRPASDPPEEWPLRRLAEANPEIYVIITTERRFVFYDPVQINSAVLLSSVERGRYLGQLALGFDKSGTMVSIEPKFIEMKEGVPEDELLLREQERLAARLR